jgi:hypothetical protein
MKPPVTAAAVPGAETFSAPNGVIVLEKLDGLVTLNDITQPSDAEFVQPVAEPSYTLRKIRSSLLALL